MGFEENVKVLEADNKLKDEIIQYTPGGMHVCYLSDPIHLEYASQGLANMLGYTLEEFEAYTKQLYIRNVYEDDIPAILDFFERLRKNIIKGSIEYRMVRKDGSLIWVLDTMDVMVCDDGIVRGYSSVLDITETKKAEESAICSLEKAKKMNQRFSELLKFSEILYFEYNKRIHKYTDYANLYEVMGYTNEDYKETLNERMSDDVLGKILGQMYYLSCPEDREKSKACADELESKGGFKSELRFLCADYEYHWFEIEMHQSNEDEDVVIGYMRNIDNRVYKRESLKHKIATDPMTGVLNKVAAFTQINAYVKEHPNALDAFLFFDIDDFKCINDTLGHDIGDQVIVYLARSIASVFRNDDVVARFGGDEFVVFMKNIQHRENAFRRAREVNELCKACPYLEHEDLNLSVSTGISYVENIGTKKSVEDAIHSVFIEADRALYKVKVVNKGDIYCETFTSED